MFGHLLDMIGDGEPVTINAAGELVDHQGNVVGQVEQVNVTRDTADFHTLGGPSQLVEVGPTRVEINMVAYDRSKQLTVAPKPEAPPAQADLDDGVDLTEELGE